MSTNNPSSLNAVLIQGCTLADVERMINKAVDERISAFLQEIQEKPTNLLTRKEAADRLGVSLPTLAQYSKYGFIKSQRIGGRVYYAEAEVDSYGRRS